MVEEKSKVGKAIAIGIIALVAGGLGTGLIVHNDSKAQIETLTEKTVTLNDEVTSLKAELAVKPTEVVKEVIREVEVPGAEVIKTVEVESPALKDLLQLVYDRQGDLEFITEDLKETEVDQIVDRIGLIYDFSALSEAEVKDEAFSLLHREEVTLNDNSTVVLDKHDLERLKVYSDLNDVTFEDLDFEDKDGEVLVPIRFEQDDVKFEAVVRVTFKSGEVDDVELESVGERS